MTSNKIVITGAAGLLGQHLIPSLKSRGYSEIVAIDKSAIDTAVLRRLHPEITVIEADIALHDGWQQALGNADALICCHAQIDGFGKHLFQCNNVLATRKLLDAARLNNVRYLVHISSASVNSACATLYSESKKLQEALVNQYDIPRAVLRPTLMFGTFDSRNLGWLARFMAKTPIFPIPGNGYYSRQPLYVGDLCNIIGKCVEKRVSGEFNISGLSKVNYVDLMRMIQKTLRLRTHFIEIPYGLFWLMLKMYGLIDRNPPFTTNQLKAFTTPDEFQVVDWPSIFGVAPTPLDEAIAKAFPYLPVA